MSFPLDYDSACDTCTPAAVCVFIFKSFAVLSVKSRTLPVKSDSWGKRKSLFPFLFWGFVVGTLVLLLFVVFCLFLRQGGMHAIEAGLKLTLWLIMTSCGWNICTPPHPLLKTVSFEWPFLCVKAFLTPLLRRWESPLSFRCCFSPIPFSTQPRPPPPDMWCICVILELLNLGVGMPSLLMCARP